MTATGTVYSLTDPRDGQVRYIGQTTKTLRARLTAGYAPRVQAWIAELRVAGVAPVIAAVREDVPVAELLVTEREEITRVLVMGGTLLNELSTAEGRELVRQYEEAARDAAGRAAWRELASIALDLLGGPLPPGDLPAVEIPDTVWRVMLAGPSRRQRIDSLRTTHPQRDDEIQQHYQLLRHLERDHEEAARELQWTVHRGWGDLCHAGGKRFAKDLDHNISMIAETACASREEAAQHLALMIWYMVAVHPWRHLAELAGLAQDDEAFIAWAGGDASVRGALSFLACRSKRALERIPHKWYSEWEKGPGHTLAAVVAAYSGLVPGAVRSDLLQVLEKIADDHELTQPMADLLLRLNPKVLDSVFGQDVAAAIDGDLGLTAGTAGSVLQAFGKQIGHIHDNRVRRAIDRATQGLPVVPLPDYGGWYGPGILAARVISASLVRAGLAEPERCTPADYLAKVRGLWTPDPSHMQTAA